MFITRSFIIRQSGILAAGVSGGDFRSGWDDRQPPPAGDVLLAWLIHSSCGAVGSRTRDAIYRSCLRLPVHVFICPKPFVTTRLLAFRPFAESRLKALIYYILYFDAWGIRLHKNHYHDTNYCSLGML